eukprot:gnl/TRDRNA2_/TRDRNA2_87038_c0_seq1.p1 gnl/TRDRNA2_/TRDRNA2_87038_c0~~gnl/TRDRNA2_/TRDRNA2_87038_c0_seq1.p1  ORF type:complete len:503 (+),score=63.96 gnl/TRDRNA2_/TRDRNA2_87038_c0_seq1:25-1533(+)
MEAPTAYAHHASHVRGWLARVAGNVAWLRAAAGCQGRPRAFPEITDMLETGDLEEQMRQLPVLLDHLEVTLQRTRDAMAKADATVPEVTATTANRSPTRRGIGERHPDDEGVRRTRAERRAAMATTCSMLVLQEVSSKVSLGARSSSQESLGKDGADTTPQSPGTLPATQAASSSCNSFLRSMLRDNVDSRATAPGRNIGDTVGDASRGSTIDRKNDAVETFNRESEKLDLAMGSLDEVIEELRKSASKVAEGHREDCCSIESASATASTRTDSMCTTSLGRSPPLSSEASFNTSNCHGITSVEASSSRSSIGQSLEGFEDASIRMSVPAFSAVLMRATPSSSTSPEIPPAASPNMSSEASSCGITIDDFEDALERLKALNSIDEVPETAAPQASGEEELDHRELTSSVSMPSNVHGIVTGTAIRSPSVTQHHSACGLEPAPFQRRLEVSAVPNRASSPPPSFRSSGVHLSTIVRPGMSSPATMSSPTMTTRSLVPYSRLFI